MYKLKVHNLRFIGIRCALHDIVVCNTEDKDCNMHFKGSQYANNAMRTKMRYVSKCDKQYDMNVIMHKMKAHNIRNIKVCNMRYEVTQYAI